MESLGAVHGRARDQNSGEAHKRVEGCHQLGHAGHGDLARQHRAHTAANGGCCEDQANGCDVQLDGQQGCDNRNRHADHAICIALTAGFGARKAAQGQNEQDPGDEIKKGCNGWGHLSGRPFLELYALSSCT